MAAAFTSLTQPIRWRSEPTLTARLAEVCLIALICLSILAPPLTSAGSSLWLKFEQVALPVAILIYGWMMLSGRAQLIRPNGMFAVAAAYCACILISMWWGSVQLGQAVILRDFYELPKSCLPAAFFTLAYESELSEDALRKLYKFYGIAIFLVCAFAWAQWMKLGFTYTLDTYYSSGMHDDVLESTRRVYSTFGNANVLGELMVWGIAAFLLAALGRIGNRAWDVALAFSCLITLAMTGSRYGLLNGCLTFVLMLVLPAASRGEAAARRGFLLVLFAVFALTFAVVAKSNARTLDRFETLQNPLQVDSFRGRVDRLWVDALDQFKRSPVLGRGPAKTIFTGIYTDSEYLNVLKEFGVVGFVAYSMYFLVPLSLLVKGLQAARRAGPFLERYTPATFLTLRLAFIMVIMAMVMNIGMSTFYNAQLQGFLWMWLGLGARCAKNIGALTFPHRETASPPLLAFSPRPGWPQPAPLGPASID